MSIAFGRAMQDANDMVLEQALSAMRGMPQFTAANLIDQEAEQKMPIPSGMEGKAATLEQQYSFNRYVRAIRSPILAE